MGSQAAGSGLAILQIANGLPRVFRHELVLVAALTAMLFLSGCGGGAAGNSPTIPSPNVNVLMQDAPADGVLAFNVTLDSATLAGGGTGGVDLVGSGQMEFRHLELAPTLALEAQSSQLAAYTSVDLTISDPQLAVLRDGKVIRVNGSTSPSARLARSSVSVPLTGAPDNNGRFTLLLDFDLQHSVALDSSGNYVITPTISATAVDGHTAPVRLFGAVATITGVFFNGSDILSQVPTAALSPGNTGQVFQAQLMDTGQRVSVMVDSSTMLDKSIGQFSNLHLGQMINLSAEMLSTGVFLANSIAPGPPAHSSHYQGVVTGIQQDASGNASIQVVVQN